MLRTECLPGQNQRRRKEVWDGGGAKPQGVWGTAVTNGVQGRIPGKGSGGRNLPLAEEIFK